MANDEGWILGYLSGLAVGYRRYILVGRDANGLFSWIDNYCHARPLAHLDEAADELFNALVQGRE